MDAKGSWSGGCQVRPADRALSHPADFKPGLQNPDLTLNFAGAFSVDNMNQALPAWNFKVPEFGGLRTKRCVLRHAGLLCAEKDWHKTRATNNWAMGMAVPVSPNMQSQHNCCALPASCCHHLQLWVLRAWFGFSEVLSKRYHVYIEAGEKSSEGCLCVKVWKRCCGKEHSGSHGLRWVSWLPPPAPDTSCSLEPSIWVWIQKPLISWICSFCGNSTLWCSAPEIVVCGLSWWPWPWAQLYVSMLDLQGVLKQMGSGSRSQHPTGWQAQLSLRVPGGDIGMTSTAHLMFAFPNISPALAFCWSRNWTFNIKHLISRHLL